MSTTVVRIRRRDGVVVQDCDVYVGRAINMGGWHLPSSKWANPFRGDRDECIKKYEAWILSKPELLAQLGELKGKRLGCWCHPLPCHADVLVRLAEGLARPNDASGLRPETPT